MTEEVKEEVVEISGQEQNPVEEAPESALPTEEQTPTTAVGELPAEVAERTRAEFEKLKSHNKELSEKLSKLESKDYGSNVFESVYGQPSYKQPNPAVPQVAPQQEVPDFVDADGYVDTAALERSFSEMSARTQRAEAEAKKAQEIARQQEEDRQVKEAHGKFPWLDPANKDLFDPTGFELVKGAVLSNMWEGKRKTLAEVAEEVEKFRSVSAPADEIKEQAVNEYKEKQTVKANASAVQTGKGQPREETVRLDELKRRTQLGDENALDERLKNI